MKKISIIAVVIIIVLGALYVFTRTSADPEVSNGAIVATVNGQEIARADLDAYVTQIKSNPNFSMPEGGAEAEAELRRLALDDLINNLLLSEDIALKNITISEAEVTEAVATVQSRFESEEAFESELAAAGHTRETFLLDIRNQLTLSEYYDYVVRENNIIVTDAEARAIFTEQIAPQDDSLIYENIEADIKTQLKNQKIQVALLKIIEELRASADITILL